MSSMVNLASSNDARVITESDTVPVASPIAGQRCRAIYVGGIGDLHVKFRAGEGVIIFSAIPVGTILPIGPEFVMAATTATLLVAIF